MEDPAAILALMSPGFDATFRAVTAATDDMRFDALVDRDPIPFWGAGVVTLLGDAAHPVLPQTGQGAAQAMVDAVALGKALTGDVDVERALRTYERGRLEPTARLLKQGRRTARVMKTMNPVACWIRELAVRLVPVAVAARIFTGPPVSETSPGPSSSPTSSTP
jgi:2-polyprenyl-6-methoxyphenol hydroxylase-like FAD-dependent oxidoreductase